MKSPYLVVILVSFLPWLAFSQRFQQNYESMTIESSKHWLDVDYVGDGHIGHKLDVHLPKGDKDKYPVVICIYGSAWLANSWKANTFSDGIGQVLLQNGYAVVSINYRSSSDAIFPAQIQDVKAAIRFVRGNANTFSLDTSFVGITGWSSGGHLAAFAGTTNTIKSYELDGETIVIEGNLGPYSTFSSQVDAVVVWYGPTNFLIMDRCGSDMSHNDINSPESKLVGGAIQEHTLQCKLADPATYVHKNCPPFLIFHGDNDPLVPDCQSFHLQENLEGASADSKLVIIKGGKHGPGVMIPEYFSQMVDFFKKHTK